MMEALGVAASLIQVTDAALRVGKEVHEFFYALREAEGQVREYLKSEHTLPLSLEL